MKCQVIIRQIIGPAISYIQPIKFRQGLAIIACVWPCVGWLYYCGRELGIETVAQCFKGMAVCTKGGRCGHL